MGMEKIRFFGITFKISKSDFNQMKNHSKTMYVCTHNYDPYDIFATMLFAKKIKDKKYYHISNKNPSTRIGDFITPYFSNSNIILITNNTVKKAVDVLNNNHNLFIYI